MNPPGSNRLIWWVASAFLLMALAWTAMFMAASRHRVPEVPLATPATKT